MTLASRSSTSPSCILNAGFRSEGYGLIWKKELNDAVACMKRAQEDLARARARWEGRTVAFVNSLTLSSSGQVGLTIIEMDNT